MHVVSFGMRIAVVILAPLIAMAKDGRVLSRVSFPSSNGNYHAEEITYLSDGLRINGYLLTPGGEGKHPCIIYNRGGNPQLNSLSRESLTRGHAAVLATAGYLVVASHYRQGGGSEGHDQFGGDDLNDVLNLIPLLEREPGCDPSRIGMIGVSRGGMMTYLSLKRTERIRTAAVISGSADFALNLKSRPEMAKVYEALIPGYASHPEESLAERSAVRWAQKINKNTPILLLHGTADWRVGPAEAVEMADAFLRCKQPFRFVLFEGGAHGLPEYTQEVDRLLLNWFNDYLRDRKTWPSLDTHGQ